MILIQTIYKGYLQCIILNFTYLTPYLSLNIIWSLNVRLTSRSICLISGEQPRALCFNFWRGKKGGGKSTFLWKSAIEKSMTNSKVIFILKFFWFRKIIPIVQTWKNIKRYTMKSFSPIPVPSLLFSFPPFPSPFSLLSYQ